MTDLSETILAHLRQRGTGWVTSRAIACELGEPVQSVCQVLIKLASCKTLDSQETTWVSNKSRVRKCFVYRLVEIKATFPAWLLPPAAAVPVVGAGRVIRMEK